MSTESTVGAPTEPEPSQVNDTLETEHIQIGFPSARSGHRVVRELAVMKRSEETSMLSLKLVRKIREQEGMTLDIETSLLRLPWFIDGGGITHTSEFKVMLHADNDVVLGLGDCQLIDEDRLAQGVNGVNSLHVWESKSEMKRQEREAREREQKDKDELEKNLAIMSEEDLARQQKTKKKQKRKQKQHRNQGQGSGGQQGSSSNTSN